MLKNVLISIILCLFLTSFAPADEVKERLIEGIKQYKEGNYLGAIQTMEKIIVSDPGNALAHYYSAISYVQVGDTLRSQIAYDRVISISPNSQIARYAEIGKQLLKQENRSRSSNFFKKKGPEQPDFYGENVEQDIEYRNLKLLIEKINRNEKIDPSEYENFKDFSPDKSHINQPDRAEAARAMQILMRTGINPGMNMNTDMLSQFMQTMLSNMMMPNMADFSDKKDY